MQFKIKKTFHDPKPKEGVTHSGNFQVYFPDLKIIIPNYTYTVKKGGELSVQSPRHSFRYRDKDGNLVTAKLKAVIFLEEHPSTEDIKKDLRKRLLAEVFSNPSS